MLRMKQKTSQRKAGEFTGLGCYVTVYFLWTFVLFYRGRSEVQISGRLNQTQCCQRRDLFSERVELPARTMPRRWAYKLVTSILHCYALRNTANIMQDLIYFNLSREINNFSSENSNELFNN